MSLVVLAVAAQSIAAPPVEINHFYITVDRPTWNAIQSNRWLKDVFANVSTSTHTSGDDTWTGIYVTGVGSYVEIFYPSDFKEGQAGIGFLTPKAGGVDEIADRFRNGWFGKRAWRDFMELGAKDRQEPFAHIAGYGGQDPMLRVWLMEYHEDIFREAGIPVGSTHAQLSTAWRRKSNRPYRKLMGDVSSLTVTRGRPDLDHALQLMGFKRAGNGWKQGRSEIRFAPTATYGITEARFTLREKPSRRIVQRFGPRCVLTVDPKGEAVWRFR